MGPVNWAGHNHTFALPISPIAHGTKLDLIPESHSKIIQDVKLK